jgi:hypothetical protein
MDASLNKQKHFPVSFSLSLSRSRDRATDRSIDRSSFACQITLHPFRAKLGDGPRIFSRSRFREGEFSRSSFPPSNSSTRQSDAMLATGELPRNDGTMERERHVALRDKSDTRPLTEASSTSKRIQRNCISVTHVFPARREPSRNVVSCLPSHFLSSSSSSAPAFPLFSFSKSVCSLLVAPIRRNRSACDVDYREITRE